MESWLVKKFLIVLVVLTAIGAVAAAVAGYQLNTRYGWLASSAVFHETMATTDTRIRLAVDTLRLGKELAPYFPEDVALPDWLPWDLPALLPRVLPREVAVLGGADFREGAYNITLFVNEQRGGPALPTFINTQTKFKRSIPGVIWEEPGFTLEDRGKLSAKGHLPLPPDLEATIRETWPADPPAEPLILQGGHLAELVIDNRNGDILTLIGALAPLWNTSFEQLRQNSMVEARIELVTGITDVRAALDFASADSLVLQIRAAAEEQAGKQLEFMIPAALMMLGNTMQQRYGVTLESDTIWDMSEEVLKIDITINGVEQKLKDYFKTALPRRPVQNATPVTPPAT